MSIISNEHQQGSPFDREEGSEPPLVVPTPKAVEAGQQEVAPGSEVWVVLHIPTDLWWRPNRNGYCKDLLGAGSYTETDAKACERTRSPLENGAREDKAMPLSHALRGLQEGTVGARLGLSGHPGDPRTYWRETCGAGCDGYIHLGAGPQGEHVWCPRAADEARREAVARRGVMPSDPDDAVASSLQETVKRMRRALDDARSALDEAGVPDDGRPLGSVAHRIRELARLDRWKALEAGAKALPLGEAFQGGGLHHAPKYDVAMAAVRYAREGTGPLASIVGPPTVAEESSRLTEEQARDAIQSFLWAEFFGTDSYSLVEDGEEHWSFWLHEDDSTSYIGPDSTVQWSGTKWDIARQQRSAQDESEDRVAGIMCRACGATVSSPPEPAATVAPKRFMAAAGETPAAEPPDEHWTRVRDAVEEHGGVTLLETEARALVSSLGLAANTSHLCPECTRWKTAVEAAAGDMPVPVPEPGTVAEKLLVANVLMRRELAQREPQLEPLIWVSHTDDEGALTHDSETEAREHVEAYISESASYLSGEAEWDEAMDRVCWGRIDVRGRAVKEHDEAGNWAGYEAKEASPVIDADGSIR